VLNRGNPQLSRQFRAGDVAMDVGGEMLVIGCINAEDKNRNPRWQQKSPWMPDPYCRRGCRGDSNIRSIAQRRHDRTRPVRRHAVAPHSPQRVAIISSRGISSKSAIDRDHHRHRGQLSRADKDQLQGLNVHSPG
jgi:hypothetical protein